MKIDWEEAKTTIHFDIDSFINNFAETKRVDESYFDDGSFLFSIWWMKKYLVFPIKLL